MRPASAEALRGYLESVRRRTRRVVDCIPAADIDWRPRAGWFSFGDLVRHLAATERWMFAENVAGRPSAYPGCGPELADGHAAVLAYFAAMHEEAQAIFAALRDEDLDRLCETPGGARLVLWKWLRAMIEHEAHHRGQIYLLLALRGIATPPIFGLTSEEVQAVSVAPPETVR